MVTPFRIDKASNSPVVSHYHSVISETMDSHETDPSLPSRRGRQVHPIQTQLTSEALRSHRPRPAAAHTSVNSSERVPLSPAVKRQSSIKGFKTLFKSIRESGTGQDLSPVEESQATATSTTPVSAPLPSANTQGSSKTETPKSSSTAASAPPAQKDKIQRSLSKRPKDKPTRAITSWDPPPLFKAYPQAVKHVSLLAPKPPSDTILRLNGRRSSSATEESLQEGEDGGKDSNKKQKKKDRRESRRVSVSVNKAEWSPKIFILVTSGYLLQYTNDGHFDRLPEKMMQLTKNSVAFASDAIPGRHWVVQISQASDEGNVAPEKPKGFFSRLGLQGSTARRATKSFLLVLENPDDMNSWLLVLRREIEALGGEKYAPETPLNGKPGRPLQNQPSLKYLTKRDSLRTLNPTAELTGAASVTTPAKNEINQQDQRKVADVPSAKSVKRQSMPTRESMDATSLSTSATNTDLDKLRESSRFSYVSAGTRTIPSSRGSSPGDSPSRTNVQVSRRPNLDPCAAFRGTTSSAVASSNIGRQPQQSRSPAPMERLSQEPRSIGLPPLPSSPPSSRNGSTPNFSVPSFSKRFSLPSSSPKPTRPPPERIPRSQQTSPLPGQPSSRGTDGSWITSSDNNQDIVERPGSKLSCDGDASHGTWSECARCPSRTSSVRSNSSASGLNRSNKPSPRANSLKNYRSSHPPLSSIALPELSTLVDEFPGTPSTPSRRGSFPFQKSRSSRSSVRSGRPSRHSLQTPPQSSAQSLPIQSPPSPHISKANKAYSGSFYLSPRSHAKTAPMPETTASSGTPTSPKEDSKRRSARRSLPEFSYGPPVAPPPDCPLPEVPPIVVSQFQQGRQGSPSLDGSTSTRSRRSTGGLNTYPSEPRVQPKYDNILYNLDDDSNSEDTDALNVF